MRQLFQLEKPDRGVSGRPYDISPIDQRFLITKGLPSASDVNVSVVLNWQAELTRLVPAK